MAGYLRKYVGQYRVKAEYDLSTNDFPRLEDGSLDPSFDDLYIDCAQKIQIKHSGRNVLSCYIPSKGKGVNILRQIYQDKISETLPTEKGSDGIKYSEKLCEELVTKEVLVSAEVLDGEVFFEFKAPTLDYIAKLVKPKTSGASISPFSTKNLPKAPYKIPEKDMKLYREAIKDFPTNIMKLAGKEVAIPDGVLIQKINKQFDEIIAKTQQKGFDVKADRTKKCMKAKEYIHSMGLWAEYCEFLKKQTKE